MFCKFCGSELSDDALFCPKCGNKTRAEAIAPASSPKNEVLPNSSEFNRDVLVSYLSQLQTMEFSVNKLSQDLNELDRWISSLGFSAQISRPYKDEVDWEGIGAFVVIGVLLTLGGSFLYSLIPIGLFSLARVLGIILIAGSVIVGIISAVSHANDNAMREEEYQRSLAADRARVKDEIQQRKDLLSKRPEYEARLNEALTILDRAYEINVIPEQFRNIYAIYYLYSYLSTSQSTLESAMLHFDLNEIKTKLDTVIAQQQQIILQQAQQIAQNERMLEQNEEIIQRAIATERNTERAAQYAEIAAANSEVTAFTTTVMASIMVSSR